MYKRESDEYFHSRPAESNFVQVASRQSQVVKSKQVVIERVKNIKMKVSGNDLHRPEHWGGYRVTPKYVEFWQGGIDRLHDRLVFSRKGDSWLLNRLEP